MAVLVLLLLVVAMVLCHQSTCPLWFRYNGTSDDCYCGDDLGGLIHCNKDTKTVQMMICYGMTYNHHYNTTVVGYSLYTCDRHLLQCKNYNILPNNSHQLEDLMCSMANLNRTGQLCGNCTEGYGPPVYSHTLRCVKCSQEDFPRSLFKYLAVAFFPLTAFYFFVLVFKISVTSGHVVAYVLCSQILTMPTLLRVMTFDDENHLILSWFTLWNLDAFRLIIPPFCLHPKASILHVLCLDYIIAVYPLLLIFLTYVAVRLHERYPLVEKLWLPVYRVFISIRREWDMRGKLIEAVATFLVLSYVKILNVSADLLTPVFVKNIEGKTLSQPYLYLNAEILFFGSEHLPYGILAITMIITFNLIPMLLLLLCSCYCFRTCLRKCRLNIDNFLPLVEAFQGCYRHQCEWFAGTYLLLRLIFLVTLALVNYDTAYSVFGFYFLALTLIVTFVAPYKENIHNKMDATFFLFFAGAFFAGGLYKNLIPAAPQLTNFVRRIFIIVIAPFELSFIIYGIGILLQKVLPNKALILARRCWQYTCSKIKRDREEDSDEAFLQQLEQPL